MNSISEAQIFDRISVIEYKNDIWNKSYKEGLYFSAMEELGRPIDIHMGIKKRGNSNLSWFTVPHALHDGLSALSVLSREQNFDINIPRVESRKPRSWFRALYSAITSSPKEVHNFKDQDFNYRDSDFTHTSIKLKKYDAKVSSTALLATIVCKHLMNELSHNSSSRWMVPVRLRDDNGLQASYVGINIEKEDNELDIHYKLKEKLKNGEHWGFSLISKIGLMIGKECILYLTKKNVLSSKTIWMGSISNLGNLGVSRELEDLVILSPVRFHRPLGVALYELNGEQVVTISIHKSIKKVDIDEIGKSIEHEYSTYQFSK